MVQDAHPVDAAPEQHVQVVVMSASAVEVLDLHTALGVQVLAEVQVQAEVQIQAEVMVALLVEVLVQAVVALPAEVLVVQVLVVEVLLEATVVPQAADRNKFTI